MKKSITMVTVEDIKNILIKLDDAAYVDYSNGSDLVLDGRWDGDKLIQALQDMFTKDQSP